MRRLNRPSRSSTSSGTTSSSDDDKPIFKSARGASDELSNLEQDKPLLSLARCAEDEDLNLTAQQLFQSRVALLCSDVRVQSYTTLEDIVQGFQDFCHISGLSCVVRIRSSDSCRATLACKNQSRGCRLRLTMKKFPSLKMRHNCVINPMSLVMGNCRTQKHSGGDPVPSGLPPRVTPPALRHVHGIPGAAAGNSSSALPSPALRHVPGIPCAAAGNSSSALPSPALHPVPGIPGAAAGNSSSGIPSAAQCVECRDPASLGCSSGVHFWCAECMDSLACNQLQNWEHFLKRGCQYMCPYTDDHELQPCEINAQSILSSLKPNTFVKHVAALTEQARQQAILEIQAKFVGRVDPPSSPQELALQYIQHIAVPRCPKCDVIIVDFEACSALTCGQKSLLGEYEGGCGAKLCAWCLCEIQAGQNHHQHVAGCHFNPEPGNVHPPQPHPAVWLGCFSVQAREKVFLHIEKQRGSDERDALYDVVQKEIPSLGIDAAWLASRHEWLLLQLQCDFMTADIPQAEAILSVLNEMGYPDSHVLRRAVLFCECKIGDIVNAMRAIE